MRDFLQVRFPSHQLLINSVKALHSALRSIVTKHCTSNCKDSSLEDLQGSDLSGKIGWLKKNRESGSGSGSSMLVILFCFFCLLPGTRLFWLSGFV